MRILGNLLTFLILFFLFTAPSTAEIKYVKIQLDSSDQIRIQEFGFTNTGYVSMVISSVSVTSLPVTSNISRPDPSRFGFFLLSEEAENQVYRESEQNPNLCILDSKFISLLFTFQDFSYPLRSYYNNTYNVTYADDYSLSFANCNPLSHVTMDIRTELYNTDDHGNAKDYLSVGLTQLPCLYSIFSVIYVCFLGFWITVCFKNKPFFHSIHLLMGGLLAIRALNLMWASEDQYHVKVTGTPHGWDALYYKFQFVRAVFSFILALSTGWFLRGKEERILMETCKTHRRTERSSAESTWIVCVVVTIYLFGRFFVLGLVMVGVAYEYRWVSYAVVEIISVLFYMAIFYKLRPVNEKGDEIVVGYKELSGLVLALILVNFFLLEKPIVLTNDYDILEMIG